MTRSATDNTYSPEELQVMVDKMKTVSSAYYGAAVRTGNHAFIEFAGLMNEYIKMCERVVEQGDDFTHANVHTGNALPMKTYEAEYLAEKMECIFGPTFQSNPELGRIFAERVTGLKIQG